MTEKKKSGVGERRVVALVPKKMGGGKDNDIQIWKIANWVNANIMIKYLYIQNDDLFYISHWVDNILV